MLSEHKVMIYQSLLKETEDAAVKLIARLATGQPIAPLAMAERFDQLAGDGIDPQSKLLRRSADLLRSQTGFELDNNFPIETA